MTHRPSVPILRRALSSIVLLALVVGLSAPLLHTAHTPAAAQGDDIPLPVARRGDHPRLLITQAYVARTLKPRMTRATPAWIAFARYIDSGEPEANAAWTPGTVLRSLALAWLVTENDAYADRALAVMIEIAGQVESAPALTGAGGLDGTLFEHVAALAVGYDWLYDALNATDRAAIQDTLLRAAAVLMDPASDTGSIVWLDGQLMAFGNYAPRWLWALTAVGLALDGERAEAGAIQAFARTALRDTFLPALDLQTGGAWAEGPVYGFLANWPKVQAALAWWTARGENYFDDTDWWYDRLAYDMFLYYPTQARTYNADWGDPIHNYPSIIGDAERYHAVAVYGRAQDLLLRTVFAGTDHASWMDWFLRQPPEGMPGWMAVEEFLWRDPDRLGAPPPDRSWIAPYNGHVFMRSNWANDVGILDDTATYVSFNAGDHLAYHQFFDQGSFTLYHNGADLVARSGVYSGDGTSDHDANYYVRTIAANTVLVCDLGEVFDGIRPNAERDVWLNDCGQRTLDPAPRTAINVDYLFDNWRSYDTGSLTRFGETGSVSYLRADITGAYNSTVYTTPDNRAKVSAVIRELVYWRPGIVVVTDRVLTTYPAYTPLTVFHFQAAPEAAGLYFRVPVGESALFLQNMRPNSQITTVEGYRVAGEMVDQSWGEPVANNFENTPYAPYRLEIAANERGLEHWFMTVFIAQDSADPAPAENVLVPGDGMRGMAQGTVQVMFDVAPEDGTDIMETSFQVTSGVQYTLVTGLAPNTDYIVQAEGNLTKDLATNEAGMLLIADVPPGAVSLTAQ